MTINKILNGGGTARSTFAATAAPKSSLRVTERDLTS